MTFPLQPGEPFNPYRMFTGVFIPEALLPVAGISPGAKLVWARLARYAGENGQCYPSVKTLGAEVGFGERQTQKHLRELENKKLIRRVSRYADGAQTSNAYEFLWHGIFERGVNDSSGEGVNDDSPGGVNDSSPKESHSEESYFEERQTRLGLPRPESQKARFAPGKGAPQCRQYPELRETLADYMQGEDCPERVYPSDRHVVDVMDAAAGAPEPEVIRCLRYLHDERGLKPGSRNGPRQFSWFATVVGDYFRQKREREQAADPAGHTPHASSGGLSDAAFNSMTDAIGNEDYRWTQ